MKSFISVILQYAIYVDNINFIIPVFNLSKKKSCVKKEKTGRINQSSLSKEIVLLSKKRLFNGTENLLQTLSRRSLDRARLR